MVQIIFNVTSSAEIAALPMLLQLEILGEFNRLVADLDHLDPDKFGSLEREGRKLLRFRAKDYRFYFEQTPQGIVVHRVIHKNTLKDFLFRTKLPIAEDEALQGNPAFWEWIDRKETSGK